MAFASRSASSSSVGRRLAPTLRRAPRLPLLAAAAAALCICARAAWGLGLQFTDPTHGAVVAGRRQITLAVTGGEAQVQLEAQETGPLALKAPPATFVWDTTGLVNGEYELKAAAVGASGRAYAAIRVQVANPTQERLRQVIGLYQAGQPEAARSAARELAREAAGSAVASLAEQLLAGEWPARGGATCLHSYRLSPAKEWWAAYTVTIRNRGQRPIQGAALTCSFLGDHEPDQVVEVRQAGPPAAKMVGRTRAAPVLQFALPSLASGQKTQVRIVYRLALCTVTYDLSPVAAAHWDGLTLVDYCRFTAQAQEIEAEAPDIKAKSAELCRGLVTPAERAAAISRFVTAHCVSDGGPEAHTALGALRTGRAACHGQSELFVALCRAAGIPARTVSGVCLGEPNESASDRYPAWHMWAEAYLPGYGWVPWEYGLGKKDNWHGHFWPAPCLPGEGVRAVGPFHWRCAAQKKADTAALEVSVHFTIGPAARPAPS